MVVCAAGAFKGTLTPGEAARAMALGARAAGAGARELPVADGGDGTLDVLLAAAGRAGRVETLSVPGPLGRPLEARLGWRARDEAVVELAEASGLRRLAGGAADPLGATTLGTGRLLAAALDRGAARIVAGLGGSASTDGGAGILSALGLRLLDAGGVELPAGGGALARLDRIDPAGRHPGLDRCRLEVALDVTSPLLGPGGAAAVFAPQKGASPGQVRMLEAGLGRLAAVAARDLGADPALALRPGSGAAGGAGYALAVLGAVLAPGAALVCDAVGLDGALSGAALVLTGEGRLDAQTALGKAPGEVARRARAAGVPCVAVAGAVDDPVAGLFDEAVAAGAAGGDAAAALARAAEAVVRRRLAAAAPRPGPAAGQ